MDLSLFLKLAKNAKQRIYDNTPNIIVIPFNLVEAALEGCTYSRDGWEQKLIDFFTKAHNMKEIVDEDSMGTKRKEHTIAVKNFLADKNHDENLIEEIKTKWEELRNDQVFDRFKKFRRSLDQLLKVKLTVTLFLDEAQVSRSKYFDEVVKEEGEEIDHVVELQLVVAALNTEYCDPLLQEEMTDLAEFFNMPHNLKALPEEENLQKRDAAARLKKKMDPKEGDDYWVEIMQDKWTELREEELMKQEEFSCFRDTMDDIFYM